MSLPACRGRLGGRRQERPSFDGARFRARGPAARLDLRQHRPHRPWAESSWGDALLFLGSPIVAVAIGLVLALYSVGGRMSREEAIRVVEQGMKSVGIILLVTGAGGALGQVLRDSGTGDYVASLIARTPLPPVLLPFLVATFVRLVQGSGTVAMITAASITAPSWPRPT